MKRGKKIMVWFLGIFILLIAGIIVWFKLPYSPAKSEFSALRQHQMTNEKPAEGVFTLDDISRLPSPVQKYFKYCGYIGKPKMSNFKAYFNDVDFILSPDKPKLKIKYTQYDSVNTPERIAFIDTSMYGVPFQGIDSYLNGKGSMKGIIAKLFTLFDQKGQDLSKASLVTYLSESLIGPNIALQDFIHWEPIDETHAKAVLTYYGMSVSGIFTFDENGLMKSFTTDDRANTSTDGSVQNAEWSAICDDYKEINGIKYPTTLKAIWHYKTGDLVYFDAHGVDITYNALQ